MKKLILLLFTLISAISFSQNKNTPFTVKLFCKGTIGDNKAKSMSERTSFRIEKNYIFCYDSEEFHHLELTGNADNISVYVSEKDRDGGADKVIYLNSRIYLKGTIKFTTKDFNFQMGDSYIITIIQNEKTLLFKGELSSQGCM